MPTFTAGAAERLFRHFAGMWILGGEVLARFADRGVAPSLHKVVNGSAVIFWEGGSPDITPERIKGGKIANAAGVVNL